MAHVRCAFSWHFSIQSGHACLPHEHACTEIVFSSGTEGVLFQEGRQLEYRDGSVFVYQPGSSHWIENSGGGEHVCVGVIGCEAERLPSGVFQSTFSLARRFEEIKQVLTECDRLRSRKLDLLAGLVVCDLMALQPSLSLPPRSRAEKVRDLLESSLSEPLSLDEIAGRLFVSREYLRQLFRREFGESITNYIIRRRIEVAAQFLISSTDSVKEIAAQVGFPNEYYFSRVFRRLKEMPPSEWRRKNTPLSRS
jgi:AraC-like DNA-binding protein